MIYVEGYEVLTSECEIEAQNSVLVLTRCPTAPERSTRVFVGDIQPIPIPSAIVGCRVVLFSQTHTESGTLTTTLWESSFTCRPIFAEGPPCNGHAQGVGRKEHTDADGRHGRPQMESSQHEVPGTNLSNLQQV